MSCTAWSTVLAITTVYILIVAGNGFAQNAYGNYHDADQGVQSPYGSYGHSDNQVGGNYPQYQPGQGFPPSPQHIPFYEPGRGYAGGNYWPSPSEYQPNPHASGYPAPPYYPPPTPITNPPPTTSASPATLPTIPASTTTLPITSAITTSLPTIASTTTTTTTLPTTSASATTTLPTTSASVSGLTDAQRATVLNAHNNYRRTLASGNSPNNDGTMMPQGADIIQLQYDPSIELIAQNWASGCVFDHSTQEQRNFTGENLFQINIQQEAAAALQGAADAWWSELAQFGMNPDLNLTAAEESKGIGHWSQMAWAQTARLGCGVQFCSAGNFTIVVCNYSPPGNVINQVVYQAGTPCSQCATTCSNQLCA